MAVAFSAAPAVADCTGSVAAAGCEAGIAAASVADLAPGTVLFPYDGCFAK